MRRMQKKNKVLTVMMIIFISLAFSLTSYALDAKILETNVYDEEIYIYIKGISELSSDTVVQIGNSVCSPEQISVSPLRRWNLL